MVVQDEKSKDKESHRDAASRSFTEILTYLIGYLYSGSIFIARKVDSVLPLLPILVEDTLDRPI